ncbi:hypothetical protein [Acidipila rosea]|uniref:Uncharacterized protein n=1 Tax=Acidipila rosea TaxID=768535 RepID=A0A4V2PV13_9BACT|nr:hypothetical protein [Acidipila rosea]MBW4026461.1 hypothetical protein [Acidobacteriota bacterium]MBW4044404.1 hypothetical protein [Acidobacteriota bacterium]TCK72581.1 hypothetical protein C7378_2166 [Acidipila rosea]
MVPDGSSLRQLFHDVVFDCYSEHLAMEDTEVTSYVADLLTEFCAAEKLYSIRDAQGRPVKDVAEMVVAADPIHGTAPSFDAERAVRKHIGDFSLFCSGMFPEANPGLIEMVRTGKESYYIVSKFDLFEYASEAPLFARLADNFENCMYGLNQVRCELDRRLPGAIPPPHPRRLM